MKEQVKGIIYDFKSIGWSVQKVEQELKFSNGSLGKVMNDKAGISDFRFCQLLELHQKIIKKTPTITMGLAEKITQNNLPENKEKILTERNEQNNTSQITQYEEEIKTLGDSSIANQRKKWLKNKIYELKYKT